uniref:kinesin-like protein KIF25 n=1 Tax=Pristiophorus japonicus TaxID=55135 RepID=UPI00398F4724
MQPLGLKVQRSLEQRLRQLERTLRGKEERIVQLETENALLHLKLAKCRGSVRDSREEAACLRRLLEDVRKIQTNASCQLSRLFAAVKVLKQELKSLRSLATDFPNIFQEKCKTTLKEFLAVSEKQHLHTIDINKLQGQVFQLEKSLQEVNGRYSGEKHKRKMLHNTLIELRGNIRVHCRVRPSMPFDSEDDDTSLLERPGTASERVIHWIDDETVHVKCNRSGHTLVNKMFEFERVYGPGDSQESMFEEVHPLLTSLLDGYNVCIMAYGQTGSGKTFTMLGPHSEENFTLSSEPQLAEGVIPKAARELYRLMSNKPLETYSVAVSIVEVYNNEIIDLLAKGNDGIVLGVKRDVVTTSDGGSDVPLLTNEHVENPTSILNLITHGLRHRAKHPTLVHAHSSRSHLVITITITTKVTAANRSDVRMKSTSGSSIFRPLQRQSCKQLPSPITDNNSALPSRSLSAKHFSAEPTEFPKYLKTKLHLVDLAGSECVGMSGVTGAALRETSFINRSLSALSDVLGALAEQRSHVPYRNSKLTHLLQDSIGGDAKLLVMVCVSPAQKYITESLQSLGFGTRARQVQRGHVRKKIPSARRQGERRPLGTVHWCVPACNAHKSPPARRAASLLRFTKEMVIEPCHLLEPDLKPQRRAMTALPVARKVTMNFRQRILPASAPTVVSALAAPPAPAIAASPAAAMATTIAVATATRLFLCVGPPDLLAIDGPPAHRPQRPAGSPPSNRPAPAKLLFQGLLVCGG